MNDPLFPLLLILRYMHILGAIALALLLCAGAPSMERIIASAISLLDREGTGTAPVAF